MSDEGAASAAPSRQRQHENKRTTITRQARHLHCIPWTADDDARLLNAAEMPYEFERSAYRIPYPPTARPRLRLGEVDLPVVDCSERGLRFEAGGVSAPEVGSAIQGVVVLLSGGPALPVEGTVIRCQKGEVAVQLHAPGIPVRAVFAEQRFLGQRFPARR